MNSPVDLTNLREITGADADFEKILFDKFSQSAAECLENLAISLDRRNDNLWRAAAHALKGTALGLGAYELGMVCDQAQAESNSNEDVKRALFEKIKLALETTLHYLHTLE